MKVKSTHKLSACKDLWKCRGSFLLGKSKVWEGCPEGCAFWTGLWRVNQKTERQRAWNCSFTEHLLMPSKRVAMASGRQVGAWSWWRSMGKLRAEYRLTAPSHSHQLRYVWYSSDTPGCLRTGERKERKWLSDTDHSHAGQDSPSVYR